MLSVQQAATALGRPFSQKAVLELVERGEITGAVVNKARVIDPASLVAFLDRLRAAVEALDGGKDSTPQSRRNADKG